MATEMPNWRVDVGLTNDVPTRHSEEILTSGSFPRGTDAHSTNFAPISQGINGGIHDDSALKKMQEISGSFYEKIEKLHEECENMQLLSVPVLGELLQPIPCWRSPSDIDLSFEQLHRKIIAQHRHTNQLEEWQEMTRKSLIHKRNCEDTRLEDIEKQFSVFDY